jgi:hypothetical protein
LDAAFRRAFLEELLAAKELEKKKVMMREQRIQQERDARYAEILGVRK